MANNTGTYRFLPIEIIIVTLPHYYKDERKLYENFGTVQDKKDTFF